MNNSCLPEYIFSEANCRCLLTHKSAFCYKQRKISSPKVIFCLHFEAGPLVSPATRLPQPSRWPCSGLGTVTRWHRHRGLRGEQHSPKTGGSFSPRFRSPCVAGLPSTPPVPQPQQPRRSRGRQPRPRLRLQRGRDVSSAGGNALPRAAPTGTLPTPPRAASPPTLRARGLIGCNGIRNLIR